MKGTRNVPLRKNRKIKGKREMLKEVSSNIDIKSFTTMVFLVLLNCLTLVNVRYKNNIGTIFIGNQKYSLPHDDRSGCFHEMRKMAKQQPMHQSSAVF